jgi:transcriptional regulator with XRE-family HTH domain
MSAALIEAEVLASIPRGLRRKNLPIHNVVEGRAEMTFENIHDLCAFVAREIQFSKKKYSKFAAEIGMSHGTVSRMATGVTQHPRAETVFQMLRALGYEVVVRS